MQTTELNQSNNQSGSKLSPARLALTMALCLALGGCSSLPKSEETNKVDLGMNKKQVISIMGQPLQKAIKQDREILSYQLDTEDGPKTHLVVLEDNEVIFSGKPLDYKAMVAKENTDDTPNESTATNSNNQTVTVSPTINVPPQVVYQVQTQPVYQPQAYQPPQDSPPRASWSDVNTSLKAFMDMSRPMSNGAAPMRPAGPVGPPANPYQNNFYGGQ